MISFKNGWPFVVTFLMIKVLEIPFPDNKTKEKKKHAGVSFGAGIARTNLASNLIHSVAEKKLVWFLKTENKFFEITKEDIQSFFRRMKGR